MPNASTTPHSLYLIDKTHNIRLYRRGARYTHESSRSSHAQMHKLNTEPPRRPISTAYQCDLATASSSSSFHQGRPHPPVAGGSGLIPLC